MIHSIHVRNFQSLRDVEIELGGLTVIVGPSSSGKSAFMRATRTLTSNRRGDDFISDGERTASISARTDKGTVTLTRSKKASENTYTVTPDEPTHPLAPQRIFSKLGGDTPPEVSDFLGIEPKDPINYAGQFDKPFLLDDAGGQVAHTLAGLTNVHIIFDAAREANRVKLAESATLRTRTADLEAIKAKVPGYRSLKAQDEALTQAESSIERARTIERQISRLSRAIEALDASEVAIAQHAELATVVVPTADALLSAHQKLQRLTTAIRESQARNEAYTAARTHLEQAQAQHEQAEKNYAEILGEASDTIAGWIAATARPDTQHVEEINPGAQGPSERVAWIRLDEAIRVFTLYIETKANS